MSFRKLVLGFAVFTLPIASLSSAQMYVVESTELARASRELAVESQQVKGAPRMRMEQDRQRIDRILDDLASGRSVDAGEVDRLLDRAESGTY